MSQGTLKSATWEAFRQGDRSAFAQIYFEQYDSLCNYGRRFGLPMAVVEDTIQDLFVELWHYRQNLSTTTSIRFYLFRALRNQLSRHRQRPVFTEMDDEHLPFSVEFSFEEQWIERLDEQDKWQALQQALNRLTPRQREVLYLRFFNDLEYAQIAEIMNISYQAARNQVYLALKAIRELFPANWPVVLLLIHTSNAAGQS